MQEIRVKIRGKKVEIVTDGFGGTSCQDATRRLEERLGTVTKSEQTEDFYRADAGKVDVNA